MRKALLVLSLIFFYSCSTDKQVEKASETSVASEQDFATALNPDTASAADASVVLLSAQQEQYALEAVAGNLARTDVTALLKIRSVTTVAPPRGSAAANDGLMMHRYAASVLELYAGDAVDSIEYVQYADAGESPGGAPGDTRIVSLCKDAAGNFYVPDTGYELPATAAIKQQAKLFASSRAGALQSQQGTDLQSDCR